MILYTCELTHHGAPVHPCARAMWALHDAGHDFDLRTVKGGSLKLWTLRNRARDRAGIEHISGQRSVPVLVLDDGEVIVGSGAIVRWTVEHPVTVGRRSAVR